MRYSFFALALISICIISQQPTCAPAGENDLRRTETKIPESPQPREVDSLPLAQHSSSFESYDSLKMIIRQHRIEFAQRYQLAKSDSAQAAIRSEASTFLLQIFHQEMFPFWFGTQWDYNGITQVPGEGQIACGYFVSTTLKHAGFKLNRYKLAQAYSHRIADVLGDRLQRLTDFEKLLAYIKAKPDDLYVVGLDNHVGFIEKIGNQVYFTHSSYWNPDKVVREEAATSPILYHSEVYVLSHLFTNDAILKKWLKGVWIPNP